MNILYLEDDDRLSNLVKKFLARKYNIDTASTAECAYEKIISKPYSLILVDYYLPDMTGLDFCRKIRIEDYTIPILFISAMSDKNSLVEVLLEGADDYLTKPFDFFELEARINILIKRNNNIVINKQVVGRKIKTNNLNREIEIEGKIVVLPRKEYILLNYFICNPIRIISRNELYENVWGVQGYYNSNTIDVHVRRLRNTLKNYTKKDNIESIYGEGYRFVE